MRSTFRYLNFFYFDLKIKFCNSKKFNFDFSISIDSTVGNIGENYNYEEDGVRAGLTPEPGSSSRESTPQV